MATSTNTETTPRTASLIDEVTSEILGMADTEGLAAIGHLHEALEELAKVFLHPTNIEPMFD
jgi:hypothetical protein